VSELPPSAFEKETGYVEDPDGDGFVKHPSVRWLLWVTDAITVFARGVLAGLFPALGGGAAGIALTETTNIADMATNGAKGAVLGLLIKGLERLHVWQLQPENEMPNPFRATPPSERPTPMVPKKDSERVKEPPPTA